MKKQLLALCLLATPLFAIAKGSAYGNTEWGMNPSQVVAAQNGKAHLTSPEKYKGSFGKVKIDNLEIGSYVYTVNFLFDSSDHLIQTNVVSNEQSNVGIIEQEFNSLNQLLTQKYGKPQYDSANTVSWKNGETTIELSKMIIEGLMAQTVVRYLPNSRVTSDTSNL